MKLIRVVVADDHDVARKGLVFLLQRSGRAEVVGEARDGREIVKLVEAKSPDLAIIDVAMPSLNGIDAAAQIIKDSPKTAVVILSMFSDEDYILRGLRAGIKGYLLKDTVEADLIGACDRADGQPRAHLSRSEGRRHGITQLLARFRES